MDTTEEAVPAITSPMRQSNTTSNSSSVETDTRRLPMRMSMPAAVALPPTAARAGWRWAAARGAEVEVEARRGRGGPCRSAGPMLRVVVIPPAAPRRGRAALTGPTPDAWRESPPQRGTSGGPRGRWTARRVRWRGEGSRELRHREEVAVEDAEPERAEG